MKMGLIWSAPASMMEVVMYVIGNLRAVFGLDVNQQASDIHDVSPVQTVLAPRFYGL